jgi:ribosomal protein S18 acetylase RimI-like enzyme
MEYRLASDADIPAMARIRAATRGTEEYWVARITGYLAGSVNPQKSLPLRAAFVAVDDTKVIGLVAGHLTRRLGCAGELQWIDVAKDVRGSGMGRSLLRIMAGWFVEKGARRVCVDPGNPAARRFYERTGATKLDAHWLEWLDIGTVMAE